jgi:hypothetical protein
VAIASYDVGDRVRLGNHSSNTATTAILDADGAPVDPAQVSLIVREPDGTSTTYTVGGPNALAKESTGRYYADVTLDAAGLWAYALVGAGTAVFREEAVLHARKSVTA